MSKAIAGATGLEIQVGLTHGQKILGRILHSLHLDAVWGSAAKNAHAIITVDGHETTEPMYEAHFVPCAAGEHDVAFSFFITGFGANLPAGVQTRIHGSAIRVVVEPDKVTQLFYELHDNTFTNPALLKVVGTRDA